MVKAKKEKVDKKLEKELKDAEEEVEEIEGEDNSEEVDTGHTVKASKPVGQVKKGDKIKVDSLTLEVDSHYVLIDHGTTKEMAIECFDSKTDKDYQIRYFNDQMERTIEFYELQEIMYIKKPFVKIEW
jgi:hypothetical protein